MSYNPNQARNAKGSPMAADNTRGGAAASASDVEHALQDLTRDNGFSVAAAELEEHTLATWTEAGSNGEEKMQMIALGDDMIAVESADGDEPSSYFTITSIAQDRIAEQDRDEIMSEGLLDDDTCFSPEHGLLYRRGVWYDAAPAHRETIFHRREAAMELVSHAGATVRPKPGLEVATRVFMDWKPDQNGNDMPHVAFVETSDGYHLNRSHPSVSALDESPAGALLRSSLLATGEEVFYLPSEKPNGTPEESYRRLGRSLVLEHREHTRRIRTTMKEDMPEAASIQFGWEALVSTSHSYVPTAVLDRHGRVILDGQSELWPDFEQSKAFEHAKDMAEDRQFQLSRLDFTVR